MARNRLGQEGVDGWMDDGEVASPKPHWRSETLAMDEHKPFWSRSTILNCIHTCKHHKTEPVAFFLLNTSARPRALLLLLDGRAIFTGTAIRCRLVVILPRCGYRQQRARSEALRSTIPRRRTCCRRAVYEQGSVHAAVTLNSSRPRRRLPRLLTKPSLPFFTPGIHPLATWVSP